MPVGRPATLTRGQVAVLMNNAGVGDKGTSWDQIDAWRKVFDVNVLPVGYFTTEEVRKADLAAISAAKEPIEGTTMTNGGVSLTVRRK